MAYKDIEKKREQNRRWAKANPEKRREIANRRRLLHGDRLRQKEAEWRRKNPHKQREAALKYEYGITLAGYDALLASQHGRCAICNTDSPGVGKVNWSVDHDHAVGRVRGLLCHHCNVGLGHFKDDPLRLEMAADYLRKTGA